MVWSTSVYPALITVSFLGRERAIAIRKRFEKPVVLRYDFDLRDESDEDLKDEPPRYTHQVAAKLFLTVTHNGVKKEQIEAIRLDSHEASNVIANLETGNLSFPEMADLYQCRLGDTIHDDMEMTK